MTHSDEKPWRGDSWLGGCRRVVVRTADDPRRKQDRDGADGRHRRGLRLVAAAQPGGAHAMLDANDDVRMLLPPEGCPTVKDVPAGTCGHTVALPRSHAGRDTVIYTESERAAPTAPHGGNGGGRPSAK